MKFLGLFFILSLSFFAHAGEMNNLVLMPIEPVKIDINKLQLPKDLKLEKLNIAPEALRTLQKNYLRTGGDISGGGFGLQIKGTQNILLHDLWCENRKYEFQNQTLPSPDVLVPQNLSEKQMLGGWPLDLQKAAPQELALALQRLQVWQAYAPELVSQLQKTLRSSEIWHGTFLAPQDRALDQFEFPGTKEEFAKFRQKFQEIQVAKVNRFSGSIYINSGLWDHMDLRSRSGLLVHESLRRLYLRSVKGYLVPSILQWMTGAIMFRAPGSGADDARMVQSFYEELMMSLDNTGVLDKNRPAKWRDQLCESREALIQESKRSLDTLQIGSEDATRDLCLLHQRMQSEDSQDKAWLILDSFRKLPSPCHSARLDEVPTYTLAYWMQKSLWVGKVWSTAGAEPQIKVRNLPAVLRTEPSVLNSAVYTEVAARFENIGQSYCAKRDDFYGKGQEFVALGDLLLQSSLQNLDLSKMDEPISSFRNPKETLDLISAKYRAAVVAAYQRVQNSNK